MSGINKNLIIGTAGHVDHGKTTLIRALTGIETDRLREEQERGMSIELGFAHFDLPGGARAGIVDVPGHERFIKNMLMGATGMDMVLLVVAADDGVMPQTREHFAILRLLDVKTGIVVLTKSDLVDEEWLELVADDVRELVKGSFLEGAPIIPVSSVTRQGIDRLIAEMDTIAAATGERLAAGPFRMPVDRVFSMPGFGTIVTGTLRSGVVRVGESAEILPRKRSTRVRQIQVHGAKQDSARAGSRVAINLVGVELSDASRGDVVAAAGSLEPTSIVDVRLELLSDLERPLAHRSRVRFHTGAVELLARITLLDREEARPGESVMAQVRLEEPAAVGRGDRFVLRRYSPGILLGGGAILDSHPRRHRRSQNGVVESLLVRERGTATDLVSQTLLSAGPVTLSTEEVSARAGLTSAEAAPALKELAAGDSPAVATVGPRWTHLDQVREVERRVQDLLREYHERYPLQPGMPREEARNRMGRALDPRLYTLVLARLESAGAVQQEGPVIRLSTHQVRLEGDAGRAAQALIEAYRRGGLNPPALDEAVSSIPGAKGLVYEVAEALTFRGDLVKLAEGLYLEREVVERTRETAVEFIRQQGSITVSQLRDAVGSSRKVMIPFLEYLDRSRITRRRGDERILY